MELIKNLRWRYATKKYDSTKRISDEHLQVIKEDIQLSASSYGLQLFKVLNIENKSIREKLKAASRNQTQITDASHLLVFCNFTDVQDQNIDEYIRLKAEIQNLNELDLRPYGNYVKAKIKEKSTVEISNWTAKQTYIALSNVLNACAELKIDSTPIEGFEPEQYNEILGLTEKGLEASVIVAIGYRSEEDKTQKAKKVRKPIELIFEDV